MKKTEKALKAAWTASPFERYARTVIKAALAEDVGRGDITTNAIVHPGAHGRGLFIAKEDFIVAGLFMAKNVFKQLDKRAVFKTYFDDGDHVKKGDIVAEVRGRLSAVLTGERVALNFLQRMSGIATRTDMFVKKIKATDARIFDTRKTTPCLRTFEKYAVRAGGGVNHRLGLFDSILIKDNHIKAAGGVKEAVRRVKSAHYEKMTVEVEVTTLKEVKDAIEAGVDIIMLDNMDPARMRKAVGIIDHRAFVEASGGVTIDNVLEIARTGVDFISIGGLTHSARSVDISLEIE